MLAKVFHAVVAETYCTFEAYYIQLQRKGDGYEVTHMLIGTMATSC